MIKSSVSKQGDLYMAYDKNASQAKWDKENTVHYSLKLQRGTDLNIIEYLNGQPNKQGVIKDALREYIANHANETSEDYKL